MNNREITTLWSRVIIEELVRLGALFFCISPGSRSTPLTVAAARHPRAICKLFADERSAGFFALGYARATGRPAVLICTSGTAVANYFPAVVEASTDAQPMLILSADRPFELLETGANQTIRQFSLFGSYSRWNFRLPEPSPDIPVRSVISAIDHAAALSSGTFPGPVHLNIPFREPFEPVVTREPSVWLDAVSDWIGTTDPLSRNKIHRRQPDPQSTVFLRKILAESQRPFFIAGRLANPHDALAVSGIARSLNIPLYADLSSGLRFDGTFAPLQQALLSREFSERFRPDAIIHFGGPLITARVATAISRTWKPRHHVVIKPDTNRYGPEHNITLSIDAAPELVAEALYGCREPIREAQLPLPDLFFAKTSDMLDEFCGADRQVSEISVARILSRLAGKAEGVFVSNSMPVRYMDLYADTGDLPHLSIGMNRGASGIDGIISTAAGFAEGLGKLVTLVIGDIAFLHDLNALSLLRSLSAPLRIVVVNNGGCGIFSFLPIAAEQDCFETYFATPQQYSVRDAAATFGVVYSKPETNRELEALLKDGKHDPACRIIEISGSREENARQHRELQSKISALAATFLKR